MTKASDNVFARILIAEAGSTATPAANQVNVYAKANGLLYSKDDAGTETLVSGGAGGGTLPGWVSAFVGTSDTTNFYWTGSDLSGFTTQTVTGTAVWTESQNLASVVVNGQTSGDAAAKLIAKTISIGDAWTVAIRTAPLQSEAGTTNSGSFSGGILFTDGTGTGANCVIAHWQISADHTVANSSLVLVGRHGTLTAFTTSPWVSENLVRFDGWLYIKLIYQAANTWRLQFSPDGVSWSAFGESDISKTMTPTHVGIAAWCDGVGDAIVTFGPLKKV